MSSSNFCVTVGLKKWTRYRYRFPDWPTRRRSQNTVQTNLTLDSTWKWVSQNVVLDSDLSLLFKAVVKLPGTVLLQLCDVSDLTKDCGVEKIRVIASEVNATVQAVTFKEAAVSFVVDVFVISCIISVQLVASWQESVMRKHRWTGFVFWYRYPNADLFSKLVGRSTTAFSFPHLITLSTVVNSGTLFRWRRSLREVTSDSRQTNGTQLLGFWKQQSQISDEHTCQELFPVQIAETPDQQRDCKSAWFDRWSDFQRGEYRRALVIRLCRSIWVHVDCFGVWSTLQSNNPIGQH